MSVANNILKVALLLFILGGMLAVIVYIASLLLLNDNAEDRLKKSLEISEQFLRGSPAEKSRKEALSEEFVEHLLAEKSLRELLSEKTLQEIAENSEGQITYDSFDHSVAQNKYSIKNLAFRIAEENYSFDEVIISDARFEKIDEKEYLNNIQITTTNTRNYNDTLDMLTSVITYALSKQSTESPSLAIGEDLSDYELIDMLLLGRALFAGEEKGTMEELRNPDELQKNLSLFLHNDQEFVHQRNNILQYNYDDKKKTMDFSFDNQVSQIGNSHFSVVLENFSLPEVSESQWSRDIHVRKLRIVYVDEGFAARMYHWTLGIIGIPQEGVVAFIDTYLGSENSKEKEENPFFTSLLQQLHLLMAGERDGLQILLEPPQALSFAEIRRIAERLEDDSDKEQIVAAINQLGLQITAVNVIH